jgi:hypothetical protein
MYPTTLDQYHFEVEKLFRQAEKERLIRTIEKPNCWIVRFSESLGRSLIETGEYLIKRTQAAH